MGLFRKSWRELADALDDEPSGELVASSMRAVGPFAGLGPPLTSDFHAFNGTWSKPPARGDRELLLAWAVSPYLRAVVARVVESYGAVEWFVPGPNQTKDFDHPAVQLLDNYNPLLIGSQGRELEQSYLETMGESITIVAPSAADSLRGPPVELIPVPPTRVTIETVAGEKQYRVQEAGGDFIFDASQIIHQRVVNLLDPYGRGSGLGRAVADEIETDEYVTKHAKAYYYNSTVPEFIGVLKGASEDKVKAFGQAFDEKHRGFRRHWRPAWINQEVSIEKLTNELDDDQIQRLRKLAFDTIRWVYGVPPEVMGVVENSNRATIQAAKDMMATFVVEPRLRKRRAMWNRFAERIWGVQVDFVSPVPREFDRRDEIMSRHPYAFTRNEIRREAGFDAVSDGNVYLVPVNLDAEPANDGDAAATSDNSGRILLLVDGDTKGSDVA